MRKRRRFAWAVLAALAGWLMVWNGSAGAWGEDGHILVARVAEQFLSARARLGIRDLLGDQAISDTRVANWADLIKRSRAMRKKYPNNDKFHYVDLPLGASPEVADKLGAEASVLQAVPHFSAILADPTKPQGDRRDALRFLVHLVGDLHQPLHCAERNGDRGGNKRRATLPGDAFHDTNLHRVWDTSLVEEAMAGLSRDDFTARLIGGIDADTRKKWGEGSVRDWALESNKLARENAYKDVGDEGGLKGEPIALSAEYMEANAEVVKGQLRKAGVRLAKVLNAAFE